MIDPSTVTVDRSGEESFFALVDPELIKPWGPDEAYRKVKLPMPLTKDVGQWLAAAYRNVGWHVEWVYEVNATPQLKFWRPYPSGIAGAIKNAQTNPSGMVVPPAHREVSK